MLLEFDGTFIFALISFIIFVMLMNLILFRPVTKIISERQKFLDKNRVMAESSKQKRDEVIKNKEAEILSAKVEASNILQKTQSETKITREARLKEKREDIKNKISENILLLNQNKVEVKSGLVNEVDSYVKLAVSKVLGEEVR